MTLTEIGKGALSKTDCETVASWAVAQLRRERLGAPELFAVGAILETVATVDWTEHVVQRV